jgi:hypothetical protein
MPADGHDFHFEATESEAIAACLDGVDALLAAPGLAAAREHIDGSGLRALLEISRIVAAHDAADSTTR